MIGASNHSGETEVNAHPTEMYGGTAQE